MSASSDEFFSINPMKLKRISDEIKLSPALKTELKEEEIKKFILLELKKLPYLTKYKNDISLLIHVCNLVENFITKSKQGETKEKIVISVLSEIFNLKEDERVTIKRNIKELIDAKQIKRISKVVKYSKDFLKLFFLKA